MNNESDSPTGYHPDFIVHYSLLIAHCVLGLVPRPFNRRSFSESDRFSFLNLASRIQPQTSNFKLQSHFVFIQDFFG